MSLPANIELEQIVLGTFLLAPESGFAVELLDSPDFLAVEHQQIFSLIRLAASEGRHLTPVSLAPAIQDVKFGQVSPMEYLLRLMRLGEPIAFLPGHIGELKQLSARRAMIEIGKSLQTFGQTPTDAIGDFLSDSVNSLDFVASGLRAQRKSMLHFSEPVTAKMDQLRTGEMPDFIHTGLTGLNKVMGGWHRGELAIIAARTSMGKTALALSSLRQAAREGTSSIFFSMEITADQAASRLLSDMVWNSHSPIEYAQIDQGNVEAYDIDRLARAEEAVKKLPLYIDSARGLTVSEVGARARRVRDEIERKGGRLDVICIDHLGKIKPTSRYAGNKVHETGEKSNALAQLALDIDVAVIALQQLNRGPEGREEKRPGLADIRDCGNIEEDADTVSFLYRPAYYLERMKHDDKEKEDKRLCLLEKKRDVLEYIIAKNRRGPICNKEFTIDVRSNAVRDRI